LGLEATKTIHRIVINPQNPAQIWVAAMGSVWGGNTDRGVFRSDDGGSTWQKVLYVNLTTGCAELVMDPLNPQKLYAAMWDYERKPWTFRSGGAGSGLYISIDGGKSWKNMGLKNSEHISEIIIHPSNPNIIYAGAPQGGFWYTTDKGANWTASNDNLTLTSLGISDIAYIPGVADSVILIGTGDKNGNVSSGIGVWRSTNGGLSFINSNTGIGNKVVSRFAVNPERNDQSIASRFA
jgi:frataxin-like iron-binding protein CyaY